VSGTDSPDGNKTRALGRLLQFFAGAAALVAAVFAVLGGRAVYVALTFQPDYSTADLGGFERILSPIMPAVIIRVAAALGGGLVILVIAFLFPLIALIAAAVAWLLWQAARRQSPYSS
jgi:hypothetical protein